MSYSDVFFLTTNFLGSEPDFVASVYWFTLFKVSFPDKAFLPWAVDRNFRFN